MLAKHYAARLLESPEFAQMQDALGKEVLRLRTSLYELGQQLNVSTATWGLSAWEKAYGLRVDVSDSDTGRRERIMAKMRGTGTVTAEMIANVVQSFVEGEVFVSEVPGTYTFVVKLVGPYGIPRNLAAITGAVEEIKPAHLACVFDFTFLLIREVHEVMTLSELESTPLGYFAGGAV